MGQYTQVLCAIGAVFGLITVSQAETVISTPTRTMPVTTSPASTTVPAPMLQTAPNPQLNVVNPAGNAVGNVSSLSLELARLRLELAQEKAAREALSKRLEALEQSYKVHTHGYANGHAKWQLKRNFNLIPDDGMILYVPQSAVGMDYAQTQPPKSE